MILTSTTNSSIYMLALGDDQRMTRKSSIILDSTGTTIVLLRQSRLVPHV